MKELREMLAKGMKCSPERSMFMATATNMTGLLSPKANVSMMTTMKTIQLSESQKQLYGRQEWKA